MKDINALNEQAFADAFKKMLGETTTLSAESKARIVAELKDDEKGSAEVQVFGSAVNIMALTVAVIRSTFDSLGKMKNEEAAAHAKMTMHLVILKTLSEIAKGDTE